MTLCETSAIWYWILGTSPASVGVSASTQYFLEQTVNTYIDPSDQSDEHRVDTGDRRGDALPHRVPLSRDRLSPVVTSKTEALAFFETNVLPARMLQTEVLSGRE